MTIHRILLFLASMAYMFAMQAKSPTVDIYDLTLDDNLDQPVIKNDKQIERVQQFQYDIAVKLKKQNFDVELMRDEQVIVITIPAGQLFGPNDTILTKYGKTALKPLLDYVKNPGFYKMLLVMHNDNTGSDAYCLNLTRSRVNAVYDWFESQTSVDDIVPYALGNSDPVVDNNSIANRRTNRRLEVYLVPNELMVAQAKKGKININKKSSN